MTNINIQQAREWAKKYQRHHVIGSEGELAAVEVIQSLPNIVVDGEEIITIYDKYRDDAITLHEAFRAVVALIPAPAPRTLADMNLEELKTHVGGEVMVDGWANPTMLVSVIGDEGAVLARRLNKPWPYVEVRPLSDLTPVAVPEQEPHLDKDSLSGMWADDGSSPSDAIESLLDKYEEHDLPRSENVPPGEPWSIQYYGKEWVGVRSDHHMEPWSIISMDGLDYRDVDDSEITLMFRLVPETL